MLATTLIVFLSGLVGLGLGQTAQINLIYPSAVATRTAAFSRSGPPNTCKIQVQFFDGESNLIKSKSVSLAPGSSTQVTLALRELGGGFNGRGGGFNNHSLFWAEAT
jgi:hypothetical protein